MPRKQDKTALEKAASPATRKKYRPNTLEMLPRICAQPNSYGTARAKVYSCLRVYHTVLYNFELMMAGWILLSAMAGGAVWLYVKRRRERFEAEDAGGESGPDRYEQEDAGPAAEDAGGESRQQEP